LDLVERITVRFLVTAFRRGLELLDVRTHPELWTTRAPSLRNQRVKTKQKTKKSLIKIKVYNGSNLIAAII
jgi:hypothetical protein